ncbi:SelB C-terminal domain-containing protein [Flavonifractor plautii]|nr:SelB C-terminal domain-containing protein [Flavonifractor plautii]
MEPRFAGRIREARRACRRLKERGVLLELSPGHLLHAGAVRAAEARLHGHFGSASFSLAQARDALGCSRRCALLLLEHWDASGVTRRQGEGRIFSTSA